MSTLQNGLKNRSNFDEKLAQKSLKNGMILIKNKPDFVKKLSWFLREGQNEVILALFFLGQIIEIK